MVDRLFQHRDLLFVQKIARELANGQSFLAPCFRETFSQRPRKDFLKPFRFVLRQWRLRLHPTNQSRGDDSGLFFTQPIDIRTVVPVFARNEVGNRFIA